ncbi:ribosome production factor 1-like [Styela clava]
MEEAVNLEDDQISITSGGVFSDVASVVTESSAPTNPKLDEMSQRAAAMLSKIGNKQKRSEEFRKFKAAQRKEKIKQRKKRQQEQKELGEDAPPKMLSKTIENMRVKDETMVSPLDQEVLFDESIDEMASYFDREKTPKVLITTSERPRYRVMKFIREVQQFIPNSHIYYRKRLALKKIIPQCIAKDFTDLIVVNEDRKTPNGLVLCHLPDGPTAHFKVSNVKLRDEIRRSDAPSSHKPEIILNNFGTRLGHRVGRMFAALFPHDPEFKGRRVVTFHNQRDYVFVRQHRYIFRNEKRVGLQELGPRFTLKLRSLQVGTFDSKFGEYEWIHKRKEMDTSRRKFHL